MRLIPWRINASARTWLAACDGWTLSQNTYCVAFEQVPMDFGLQSKDVVSIVPVPQQPLLASANPVKTSWKKSIIQIPHISSWLIVDQCLIVRCYVQYHCLRETWWYQRGAYKCQKQQSWGLEAASAALRLLNWSSCWSLGRRCSAWTRSHLDGIRIEWWLLAGSLMVEVKSPQFSLLPGHTSPVLKKLINTILIVLIYESLSMTRPEDHILPWWSSKICQWGLRSIDQGCILC